MRAFGRHVRDAVLIAVSSPLCHLAFALGVAVSVFFV